MIYLFISFYILVSSVGLAGMKGSTELMSITFLASAICYGSGAALWVLILRSFPISVAFPVASSGLIISTTLIGWIVFKEKFGFEHLLGVSLIMVGIALVSKSK